MIGSTNCLLMDRNWLRRRNKLLLLRSPRCWWRHLSAITINRLTLSKYYRPEIRIISIIRINYTILKMKWSWKKIMQLKRTSKRRRGWKLRGTGDDHWYCWPGARGRCSKVLGLRVYKRRKRRIWIVSKGLINWAFEINICVI